MTADLADPIEVQTHFSSRRADLLHAAALVARLAELEYTKAQNPPRGAA